MVAQQLEDRGTHAREDRPGDGAWEAASRSRRPARASDTPRRNRLECREPDITAEGFTRAMSRRPKEPRTWEADADRVAHDLREGLESAKARMTEHRKQLEAAGLIRPPPESPEP